MRAAIGQKLGPVDDAVELEIRRRFGSLRFNRGKFDGRGMLEIAYQYPRYIIYAWCHGADHMDIPHEVYEACRAADRTGQSAREALRLSTAVALTKATPRLEPGLNVSTDEHGRPVQTAVDRNGNKIWELRDHGGALGPVLTQYAEALPAIPAGFLVMAPVDEPGEPSFLDGTPADEEHGSFLDGIL
jgi:hypothetical protein